MNWKTAYAARDRVQLLDVREGDEWAASRIDGAVHIPLSELPARIGQLDRTQPMAGRDLVLVNDSYDNAAQAGIEDRGTETPDATSA